MEITNFKLQDLVDELDFEQKTKKYNQLKNEIENSNYLNHLITEEAISEQSIIAGIIHIETHLLYEKKCDSCEDLEKCYFRPKGNRAQAIWDAKNQRFDSKFILCEYGEDHFEKKLNWTQNMHPYSVIEQNTYLLNFANIKQINAKQKKLIQFLRKFYLDEEIPSDKGIFLFKSNRNPQNGKSFIFSIFANELCQLGKKVAYVDVNRFYRDIKENLSKKETQVHTFSLQDLLDVEVLILDNFGDWKWNDWFYSDWIRIILDNRLRQKKLTFFIAQNELNEICDVNNKACNEMKQKIEQLVLKELSI